MKKILLTSILLSLISFSASISAADTNKDSIEFLNSEQHNQALPFSEAVRVGNMLYLSGQIGVDPKTNKLVSGGMEAEAKQTMDNIKNTLQKFGYSMSDVVKCTVMIDEISKWGDFNKIYVSYFSKPYPARSAFGADGLGLNSALEVECIAAKAD